MKNKIFKIISWLMGIGVAILIILFFLGAYGYQVQNYFINKSQEKFLADAEKYKAMLLEQQKNDTYGGKTPEETLDLYIKALKAGDIELASKYYEVSVENPNLQEKKLFELKEDVKDILLDIVIKNLENVLTSSHKRYYSDNEFAITYRYLTGGDATSTMVTGGVEYVWLVPGGTEEEISKAFRLNPYTKVWKIIQ